MDNIEDFLKETEFCDFSSETIKNLAKEISKNCKNDKEFAVSVFYWVRDNILYRVGNWQKKASETLAEKEGTCTNKANLLVALLRNNNIPAGYGIMKVHGQRYFGPISIAMLNKFIGKTSVHVFVLVYINDKWIKCDPSTDKEFSIATSYFNFTTNLVDWDGDADAMMRFKEEDVIKKEYPISDIDPWMTKKSKNAKGIPLKIAHIYIRFARKNKQRVSNSEEFETLFKKYLKSSNPFYFYLFQLASLYKDIKSNFF